ncbi:amidohydrolase family protein [Sphingobium sp.]|uniref:amidohydrolase family protein n=1 Tax=Sphingobium sp. TaxID=1912891 RepID=UPI003B3B1E26
MIKSSPQPSLHRDLRTWPGSFRRRSLEGGIGRRAAAGPANFHPYGVRRQGSYGPWHRDARSARRPRPRRATRPPDNCIARRHGPCNKGRLTRIDQSLDRNGGRIRCSTFPKYDRGRAAYRPVRRQYGVGGQADMFSVMRLSLDLARGVSRDQQFVEDITALRWATAVGAQSLGLGKRVGALAPRRRADVIAVRVDTLNMMPAADLPSLLTHSARPIMCRSS